MVRMPAVMLTLPVGVAVRGVGEHVNVHSSLFHHHLNGGLRMVCMTMFALVFAGSKELPMPEGRLKLKRFAQSIESRIVFVEIATVTPLESVIPA
jgi:hypothetical protein